MKQIMNMLRLDSRLVLRDKTACYIMLAPMLLAVIMMAVLTATQDQTLTVSVPDDTPQAVVSKLESLVDIEYCRTLAELHDRVNAFDSRTGVYWSENGIRLLFQGNESPAYQAQTLRIIEHAVNQETPPFTLTRIGSGRSGLTTLFLAALLISPTIIGGIISGFNIVAEKESQMNRIYRIAPISFGRYLTARVIFAAIIGFANLTGTAVILGVGSKLLPLIAAALFSLPVYAAAPLFLGGGRQR